MSDQVWPDVLWLARHGESAGNVARREAEAAGHPTFELAVRRDMDVPLSPLGEQQARALGQWFGDRPPNERPTVVLASPYVRTQETARLICEAAGLDQVEYVVDERLREREFGVLDRLTKAGIQRKHPEQAEFQAALGKFYHRPPGGESWCDVILRLRSVVDTIKLDYCQERVLVVAHQAVVMCFRYLLEQLTEDEVLAISRDDNVANCSLTTYSFDASAGLKGRLVLKSYNFVAPLTEAGAEITREPDAPAAPK
jgi:2,3-bisphosphoglycerate-dependent phosphoglycerate mutase